MGFSRTPTGLPETVLGPREEGRVGGFESGGCFVSSKDGCQEQAGRVLGLGPELVGQSVGPASDTAGCWGRGCEEWTCVCDYSGQMKGPRGLSRHRSSGFKCLNNFNDDDRIIATHIYWELISAC